MNTVDYLKLTLTCDIAEGSGRLKKVIKELQQEIDDHKEQVLYLHSSVNNVENPELRKIQNEIQKLTERIECYQLRIEVYQEVLNLLIRGGLR